MRWPPLDPETVAAIGTMIGRRDRDGRPWTGARIARVLGLAESTVSVYRRRIVSEARRIASSEDVAAEDEARNLARARRRIEASEAARRQLIGIDE